MVGFDPEAELDIKQRNQRVKLASRLLTAMEYGSVGWGRLSQLAENDIPTTTAQRILDDAVDNGTVDKIQVGTEHGPKHPEYVPVDVERLKRFKRLQRVDPSEVSPDDEEPEKQEDSYDSSTLIPYDGEFIPITEHPNYDPSASKQQNKANIFRS